MKPPEDRKVGRSRIRVRYAETDKMGVAYYANYLIWFEVARTDFLRENGLRYRDLEAGGVFLPVGTAETRMIGPAFYDDELIVDCWMEEIRSRSIRLGYRIARLDEAGETEIATGATVLICVDEQRKSMSFPADVRKRFTILEPGWLNS